MKSSTNEEQTMEDELKFVLKLVNDWLKFAETKNAALVVAVCALMKPVIDHFPEHAQSAWVRHLYGVGCGGLIISAFVALLTFIPRLKFEWWWSSHRAPESDNLFYFGHIAAYSASLYLKALYEKGGVQTTPKKLEMDLAGQVVTNAGIAYRKYKMFTLAIIVALGGMALISVSGGLLLWG